ncbi:cellulose biosynthesis protein BcsE [Noviherbaspirillum humi]|nr:cellulose biosynthesis protein BcsE [Noviherbaspirillum humi]
MSNPEIEAQPALAIEGLPFELPLVAGCLYAILEDDDRLAAATVAAILEGLPTAAAFCLVSPKQPDRFFNGATALDAAVQSGRLMVLADASKGKKRAQSAATNSALSIDALMSELDYWSKKSGRRDSVLVIDMVSLAFEPTASSLRRLRQRAERDAQAMVLLFRQPAFLDNRLLAGLNACAASLAGLVGLHCRHEQIKLDLHHWCGRHGMLAARRLPLTWTGDGRIAAQPEEQGRDAPPALSAQLPASADEDQVVALSSSLAKGESLPAGWRQVDDDFDKLPRALAGAIAATVVLPFVPGTNFDALLRCVFQLRRRHGARLKIVVREVGARLRYSQETLVTRLGANLVVPGEIGRGRFLSLVGMLRGQVFPHGLPSSFEQALHEAMPDQEQGYLAPQDFCRAVRRSLDRSRHTGIDSVLLRLPPAFGLGPLDALRFCAIKRAGDMCSADRGNVYLFLYACREDDVGLTLERLFGLPMGELFASEERFLAADAIQTAIDRLEERLADAPAPDLGPELAKVKSAAPAPYSLAPAPLSLKAAAQLRFVPLPPAQPSPFKLRADTAEQEIAAPS